MSVSNRFLRISLLLAGPLLLGLFFSACGYAPDVVVDDPPAGVTNDPAEAVADDIQTDFVYIATGLERWGVTERSTLGQFCRTMVFANYSALQEADGLSLPDGWVIERVKVEGIDECTPGNPTSEPGNATVLGTGDWDVDYCDINLDLTTTLSGGEVWRLQTQGLRRDGCGANIDG